MYTIIWQDVPDRLRIYEYATSDKDAQERIERCHGNLIGTVDDRFEADILWLGELLGGTYTSGKEEDDTPLFVGSITPKYDSEKGDVDPIHLSGRVIVTGMIM